MSKSATQLTIETTIGRPLPHAEYTSRELKDLFTQVKTCHPFSQPVVSIPIETNTQKDPRLLNTGYLRNLYRSQDAGERAQSLGLVLKKMRVILGFEGTLINGVRILRDQDDEVYREGPNIEARPGATDFLTSLSEFADLYLCSTEDKNYVKAALDCLNWTHFFKGISCAGSRKSISRAFPELVEFLPLCIIIDDQVQTWSDQSDQKRIFLSMRFQPYKTFPSIDGSLANRFLTYFFSPQYVLHEKWQQAETSFLASSRRNQFPKLIKALKQSAEEMFYSQYKQDFYATFQKKAHNRAYKKYAEMRKICVTLGPIKKRVVLEHLILKLGGRIVQESSEANTVFVDRTTTESFGNKRTLLATEVFDDFFLL